MLVNLGFMHTKKFLQNFGYTPSKIFASPVLGQNTSKNISLRGGGGPLWASPGCPHILGWHWLGYRCCSWQDEGNSMKSSRGNKVRTDWLMADCFCTEHAIEHKLAASLIKLIPYLHSVQVLMLSQSGFKKQWNPTIKGIWFILKIEKSYIHIDALNTLNYSQT